MSSIDHENIIIPFNSSCYIYHEKAKSYGRNGIAPRRTYIVINNNRQTVALIKGMRAIPPPGWSN